MITKGVSCIALFHDPLSHLSLAHSTKPLDAKIVRAAALNTAHNGKFAILIDNDALIGPLMRASPQRWIVWLKVDCGYGRAGRAPALLAGIASMLRANPLSFELRGYYTHAGHSYHIGAEQVWCGWCCFLDC